MKLVSVMAVLGAAALGATLVISSPASAKTAEVTTTACSVVPAVQPPYLPRGVLSPCSITWEARDAAFTVTVTDHGSGTDACLSGENNAYDIIDVVCREVGAGRTVTFSGTLSYVYTDIWPHVSGDVTHVLIELCEGPRDIRYAVRQVNR
jgi:hypothetical protein